MDGDTPICILENWGNHPNAWLENKTDRGQCGHPKIGTRNKLFNLKGREGTRGPNNPILGPEMGRPTKKKQKKKEVVSTMPKATLSETT